MLRPDDMVTFVQVFQHLYDVESLVSKHGVLLLLWLAAKTCAEKIQDFPAMKACG